MSKARHLIVSWILVLSFIISFATYAQELAPIENFAPIDYSAENQNWGISQSEQKNIYIANNGGLLEFNGASWRLYGSPNGSTIRSVKAIDDIIFTGCYMEFGFWKKNVFGDLEYKSISRSLPGPLIEDEEFWNILNLDDWILFQSKERIYIYHTVDESIKIIESKSTKAQLFDFEGSIFYHSIGKGLFKIENGESVLVSAHPIVKNTIVSGIFSIDSKPLLITEKGEFYFLEKDNLIPWNNGFSDEIGSINVYSSLQLADRSMVLGTISNGIYQIGKDGKILQQVNQEKGLNNNTVLSIFEDNDSNLWLALDNGVSVINMHSPFKEFIDKNGRLGVVYAAAIFNDYLYLGTNQGLFSKRINTEADFEMIKGTGGQVWMLKIIGETLFCGHNNGTYTINEDNAALISNFPGTWNIKPIPNQENLLLQGNFNGLSVLTKKNNNWELRNIIEGFDISSRFFEFVNPKEVIVNHEFKGVFNLDFDSDFSTVTDADNSSPRGIGASLATYANDILYTCAGGIFKYSNTTEQLAADSLLTDLFYGHADDPVGIFISDVDKNRLWAFTSSNIVYAQPGRFNSSPEINKIAIPSYVRKNLGVLGFESLTPLDNEKYLVGISNGYLTVDLNKLPSYEYAIGINSISKRSNNTEIEKISKEGETTFKSSENNFFFSYNIPEFDKYTEVTYQYQLQGLYANWSEWTTNAETSFENLPSGDYVFNVRARVGNTPTKNMASYHFSIARPWYFSNLLLVLYFTVLSLLAILIHKMYKRYYRKQREQLLRANKKKLKRKKLKAQKKIVQINNEKLKEEVASKNRELAISTMSIIKKNEFLNAIKDQLKSSSANPDVKSVIRTIDRNINNVDDWKFFEDAFNNADKDFLKKVKSIHPELTANDLRLCAYLRLNLTSKEIAPLLNISVRSVEVKRYRLRKKMNLPHEDGLANHIMQI